jgi:hypothetical protein
VGDAAEGLDRREEDVGVWLPLLAHVEAQSGVGPDPPEGVPGLLQDLLAVRSEEDVAELGAVGVVARTTRPAVSKAAELVTRSRRQSGVIGPGLSGSGGTLRAERR